MVHPRVLIYFEAAKLLKFMQLPAKFFVFLWLIKQYNMTVTEINSLYARIFRYLYEMRIKDAIT
ncbi:MAG: hypothetical protein WCS66_09050, partial [Bacteroidales bacterium]